MNIVILERDSVGNDVSVDNIKKLGNVTVYGKTNTIEEVKERTKDADIVISNKAPMSEESLSEAHNLKYVCNFATGFDNCDIKYLRSRNIGVSNVQDYCTDMVAQHTFALALALVQKLSHYDEYVKSGRYSAQESFSNFSVPFFELSGKTWGIVGMGNIGRKVANIASVFGCKVIFCSVTGKSGVTEYKQVDKDTLLKECDILSMHCPLSELTIDFIDKDSLKKMKKTAILINVARGKVVNNTDLYEALMSGEIAAAGLDVVEEEPLKTSNPLSKIKDSTKLIITPHLGWGSVEARQRCVDETAKNIEAFLMGKQRNIVN